jgi:hypothetical protein
MNKLDVLTPLLYAIKSTVFNSYLPSLVKK